MNVYNSGVWHNVYFSESKPFSVHSLLSDWGHIQQLYWLGSLQYGTFISQYYAKILAGSNEIKAITYNIWLNSV